MFSSTVWAGTGDSAAGSRRLVDTWPKGEAQGYSNGDDTAAGGRKRRGSGAGGDLFDQAEEVQQIDAISLREAAQERYLNYSLSVITSRGIAGCSRWTQAGATPDSIRHGPVGDLRLIQAPQMRLRLWECDG